jgi:DNA-binding transcriptional ArsR family regulator
MNNIAGESDLAAIGAVLAEPARTKVLLALADGRALAASVLAAEAGVSPSTASHHLARLLDAGLIRVTSRGRHRYFALSGPEVGEMIEAIARVAPTRPVTSLREGTRAHQLRYARSCYDHLAGRVGVAVADALAKAGLLSGAQEAGVGFTVTASGARWLTQFGVRARAGETARACLDWTEQRHHLAGPLGRAMLARLLELEWVSPTSHSRALRLTDAGHVGLLDELGLDLG